MTDALALLTALQAAQLPVLGMNLRDLNDATTWRFDGLSDAERDQAVALLTTLIKTPDVPPVTLDEVVIWCAGQFGQTLDDARAVIADPTLTSTRGLP